MPKNLLNLADKWELIARNKYISAERRYDNQSNRPTGKQFAEHGAICYYNCARELREALSSPSPSSLTILKECQK